MRNIVTDETQTIQSAEDDFSPVEGTPQHEEGTPISELLEEFYATKLQIEQLNNLCKDIEKRIANLTVKAGLTECDWCGKYQKIEDVYSAENDYDEVFICKECYDNSRLCDQCGERLPSDSFTRGEMFVMIAMENYVLMMNKKIATVHNVN